MEANVLILDGAIHRTSYRPTEGWRRYLGGAASASVHLPSGEPVPGLAPFTHLILTGSEASIVDRQSWYDVESGVLRDAFDRGMPILGSCFGHQMLALALSGETHVAHSATPELGWIEVEVLAADPILEGIPRPFHCFASHFDEVRRPPEPWRVLARSDRCPVQVMRYGDSPVWGIQAHPEIAPAEALGLLNNLIETRPGMAHFAGPALEQADRKGMRDDRFAATLVENFLRV